MNRKELLFTTLLLIPILTFSQVNYNNNNILPNTVGSAIGQNHTVNGHASFAAGSNSSALGNFSFAMGFFAESYGDDGFAFGRRVRNSAGGSFTIGGGYLNTSQYLINGKQNTLMIGFNSTAPTLFVSESDTDDQNTDRTGKVAIGNVPNLEPQAKLHIYSDQGEDATFLIEPKNWATGRNAKLMLGETSNYINANKSTGIEFGSQNNFVFNGSNTGFGVSEPKAKIHISGDLLFEESENGIILKSEDGKCWKGNISNDGQLVFNQIDCDLLTSSNKEFINEHPSIFIYPNPATKTITIDYNGNKKNLTSEIRDINGVLLLSNRIQKGKNDIDLIDIKSRVVIVSVYTKKGDLISTTKVLIKR